MATYQIDLDKLVESKETYKSSATELEEYMERSRSAIQAVDREAYDGQDADALRTLFLAYIAGRFNKTKEMAQKVTQKLSTACITGKQCKMRCYNFICAFEGAGRQDADSFGGKLYCDQEQIVLLKRESMLAMDHGYRLRKSAAKAEQTLSELKIVQVNSGEYVTRINEGCAEVDRLENYSIRMTDYAGLVEEMDDNLQGDLRECIPMLYKMTADGIDDRQEYLDMEPDIGELERLLNIPDKELSDADRAKRDVLLMKLVASGDMDILRKILELGIVSEEYIRDLCPTHKMVCIAEGERGTEEIGDNHTKYNEWFWEKDISAAWCAAFVLWCANEAGLMDGETLPLYEDRDGMALVINVRQWYSDEGRYHSINEEKDYDIEYVPCEGDFFVSRSWDAKAGKWQYHIGIVAGYDKETRTVYTIEGNTDDKVQHGVRSAKIDSDSGIQGFCSNGGLEAELPENWENWKDIENADAANTR